MNFLRLSLLLSFSILVLCACTQIPDREYEPVEYEHSADTRFVRSEPNPFGPSTYIQFDLKKAGFVELVITDEGGAAVDTLCSGHMEAGESSINWTGHNWRGESVPSGIYYFHLAAADTVKTGKLTLIKYRF